MANLRVSFTGSRLVTKYGIVVIEQTIKSLARERISQFTSGGADGVDTTAALVAMLGFTARASHRVILPNGEYNPFWDSKAAALYFQITKLHHGNYMTRNDALVEACDILIAFPAQHLQENRSGTWATIRRGWKAQKDVRIFPLNGERYEA
jgi:hypothetical protein